MHGLCLLSSDKLEYCYAIILCCVDSRDLTRLLQPYRLRELDKLKGHVELVCQVEDTRHRDRPAVHTRCDDLGFHDCVLRYNYLGNLAYSLRLPNLLQPRQWCPPLLGSGDFC